MATQRFTKRFDNKDRTTLSGSIYEEIKLAIIELRFRPGEVLRESAVGQLLGVSKTPVREALLKLEHDGLVDLIPFKGAIVSGYGVDDVREILQLRSILQSECVRRVANERDQEMIRALRDNVAASQQADEAGDIARVVSLFDEFDAILLSRLDNRRAMSFLRNMQDHMMRIGQLSARIPGRTAKSIEQHSVIVNALEHADAEAAAEAMRHHLESVLIDEMAGLLKSEQSPLGDSAERPESSDHNTAR